MIAQVQAFDPGVGSLAVNRRRHAVQPTEVRDLFAHLQLGVESALFRQVAEAPPRGEIDRRAVPGDAAAVGDEDPEDHSHRRGLARAVRAYKAERAPRRTSDPTTLPGAAPPR